MGSAGEVYLARTGTYGELFPAGGANVDPTGAVLALDILRPGEAAERLLVPGTEGADSEELPTILFEEPSKTLFLVWETRLNHIFPVLTLAVFDTVTEQFTDNIPIIGNPMAMKTTPQLAITRDTYSLPGSAEVRHRTIVHLLWGEEDGSGLYQAFYTPIVLENGSFVGHNPIYHLNELDAAATAAGPFLPTDLVRAQGIQPGRDGQTVIAAFTSPTTGQIVAVEIDVLPAQLSLLADDARLHIVDIGHRLSYPAHLQQIADSVYNHILDAGRAFYPEIVQTLAEQIRAQVLQPPPAGSGQSIEQLADKARLHIVDIGSKYSGRGLRTATSTSTPQVVEIAGNSSADARVLNHLILFRVASTRAAPVVPATTGAISFFAARTGQEVAVAWAQSDRVQYVASNGADWDAVREIRLSDTIDLQRAYDILAQRMNSR